MRILLHALRGEDVISVTRSCEISSTLAAAPFAVHGRRMNAAAIMRSLELVGERGDPAPAVYARLFARYPAMEALFVRDTNGLVRGNMLAEAIGAILDFIDRDAYGGNLMRIEVVNHENLGVPKEVFPAFFTVMRDSFAETLGEAWTTEIDQAWGDLLARIEREVMQS